MHDKEIESENEKDFRKIFGVPEPKSSGFSIMASALSEEGEWQEACKKIVHDLKKAKISIDTNRRTAGVSSIIFGMCQTGSRHGITRKINKSILRIGRLDKPINSVTLLKPVMEEEYEVNDLIKFQVRILPYAPDDPYGKPRNKPSEEIDEAAPYELPDVAIDIRNTLKIMEMEGYPPIQLAADEIVGKCFTYLVNPETNNLIRYPDDAPENFTEEVPKDQQKAEGERRGRPILFVRDYNAFIENGGLCVHDNGTPDVALYKHLLEKRRIPDPDDMEPVAPEQFERLKAAFDQQSTVVEAAKYELRHLGVNLSGGIQKNSSSNRAR